MKLLIIDDHPVVRAGLKRLFPDGMNIDMHDVAHSRDALGAFRTIRPDIVVLDINLAGVGGIEVLKRLLSDDPKAKILVFSMHIEPIYATHALQAGALGYVSKSAPPEEIIQAIESVGKGESYIERQIAQELALRAIPGKRGGADDANALSAREIELLRLLASGKKLAEMASIVGVSYKTVANSLSLLKTKLGVARTSDLVHFAIRAGIST
jgi:two-component system invasion response regulator UvrY